eukprot:scaffold181752_cov28-Tisochrysis_lutea.AAC.1
MRCEAEWVPGVRAQPNRTICRVGMSPGTEWVYTARAQPGGRTDSMLEGDEACAECAYHPEVRSLARQQQKVYAK